MGSTRFNVFKQFDAQAVTGTNTYTSAMTNIGQQHNIGIQVNFTGTMAGTLSVLCSNDGVNFTDLTFDPVITQPSGANLGYLISCNQLPFLYLSVQYVNTSGTGTLTSILTSKDLS
jgi:hypothetical protein